MKTVEKNPTLISVDKISIERTKEGLQNRADLLNKFVELSEKTLKTTFTAKEKINLKDNGLTFVDGWIKPKFKFPDADYNFNMQALGIDIAPITSYWNANAKQWNGLSVELDKGKFFIPDVVISYAVFYRMPWQRIITLPKTNDRKKHLKKQRKFAKALTDYWKRN